MSPKSKRELIPWTKDDKKRLWDQKTIHRHLSWQEFHRLDLFPDRTESSVQVAWSRLLREKGVPRGRRGQRPAVRARKTSARPRSGFRALSVPRHITTRTTTAASARARDHRLRRPLRPRPVVNETASASGSGSGSKESEYESTSSDNEGDIIRARDIVLDDEMSVVDRSEPLTLVDLIDNSSDSSESTESETTISSSQTQGRSQISRVPHDSGGSSGSSGDQHPQSQSPTSLRLRAAGPNPRDPPIPTPTPTTTTTNSTMAMQSVGEDHLAQATVYLAKYTDAIKQDCKDNHSGLLAEIERLKADNLSLHEAHDRVVASWKDIEDHYADIIQEKQALSQQVKTLKVEKERLEQELDKTGGIERAIEELKNIKMRRF